MAANPPREIVDAEFEVIEDPRSRRLTTWTFWEDDFPALASIAAAGVTALAFAALFPHGLYWFWS